MTNRYILETNDFVGKNAIGIRVRDNLQGGKVTDQATISYKAVSEWRIQPAQIQDFIEEGLKRGMTLATILDLLNRSAMVNRTDPVEDEFAKLKLEVEGKIDGN
jgi:hypothetical protein